MQHYVRKPIPPEAVQFTADRVDQALDFAGAALVGVHRDGGQPTHLTIRTLEGCVRASMGDCLVRGVKGEVWPVRQDVFAETYEPVPAGGAE